MLDKTEHISPKRGLIDADQNLEKPEGTINEFETEAAHLETVDEQNRSLESG